MPGWVLSQSRTLRDLDWPPMVFGLAARAVALRGDMTTDSGYKSAKIIL
jgi:hypothetical protein